MTGGRLIARRIEPNHISRTASAGRIGPVEILSTATPACVEHGLIIAYIERVGPDAKALRGVARMAITAAGTVGTEAFNIAARSSQAFHVGWDDVGKICGGGSARLE